ncbi:MAG: ArsR/SmtB family transcription factor [Candidatus Geothermarchaeales archaeon]
MERERSLEETSPVFKALGNPTRLRILTLVSTAGRPLHIKGVSRHLEMDYAAVYRHVRILETAGLLKIYEVGRSRVLSIAHPESLAALLEAAESITPET